MPYAVIIAGGNGERFWPISTPERPKQFVTLFGGRALIRQAVDRIEGLVPADHVIVITAQRLVPLTRKVLPMVPRRNVIGEPCRRDTAAAVAAACGIVKRLGGDDAVACVLPADQIMEPVEKFRQTLKDAIKAARKSDSIVTLGIAPTYPATGFGYIERDAPVECRTKTRFHQVRRFVEKPCEKVAKRYLAAKRFYWNAGIFIWKVSTMEREFARHAPDIGRLIGALASSRSVPAVLKREYPSIRQTSVDYAVMEKTREILVAHSEFAWDDVGSWFAVPNHFPHDAQGNTCFGRHALLDVADSVVVSTDDHLTAVVGVSNLAVVHTDTATLVCAKDRVQDVKRLLRLLDEKSSKSES